MTYTPSHDVAIAPRRIAAEIGRQYPTIWRRLDEARARRLASMPAPSSWLSQHEINSVIDRVMYDQHYLKRPTYDGTSVMDLITFGSWRITQGVYCFDLSLREAIVQTPLDINLPASVLSRLPEWSVYVDTSGMSYQDAPIAGLLATIVDGRDGDDNGALLLTLVPQSPAPTSETLIRFDFPLSTQTLWSRLAAKFDADQSIGERVLALVRETETILGYACPQKYKQQFLAETTKMVTASRDENINDCLSPIVPFLSLVLYLCSEEPDLPELPQRPKPTVTKRGERYFPPQSPAVWSVGVRVGAALRSAQNHHDQEVARGSARGVRPHWRRAHWHRFWVGPRNGKRTTRVRWIMPTLVNATSSEGLPTVIRPVLPA